MPTCQEMADFYAWQVEIGHGKWSAALNPKSILCRWSVCQYTEFRLPTASNMYDEKSRVVFLIPVVEP